MEDESLTEKAEMYKNKGNDEFKKGQFNAAINFYSDAIECDPNEPAYYTNRAIAFIKQEKFLMAKQDCQRALSINSKFAKAFNRLSKCHIGLGDLVEASISLQKSFELDPGNPTNKKD